MLESYKQLFAQFPDALFVEDASGCILEANAAAARMLGVPPDELVGRNSLEFLSAESLERISPFLKSLQSDHLLRMDARYIAVGGRQIDVEIQILSIPWKPDSGEFPKGGVSAESAHLIIARPCGEWETNERELQALREASARSTFGLPRALFYVTSQHTLLRFSNVESPHGNILDWVGPLVLSPRMKTALDRAWSGEEVLLPAAWYAPNSVPAGANISGALAAVAAEARMDASQRQYWLRLAVIPMRNANGISGLLIQAVDCTSQRLEAEHRDIADGQRMLALLASSIHHELNNYLSVILAQASAMRMTTPQGQLPPPNIGAIIDASHEAVGLLRRSAETLGRMEGATPEANLNEIVADTVNVLRHIFPANVKITAELGIDVPRVRADEKLIRVMIVLLARHLQARPAVGALVLKTFRPQQTHPSLVQAGFSIEDARAAAGPSGAWPAKAAPSAADSPQLTLARAIARQHRSQLDINSGARGTVIEMNLPGVEARASDKTAAAQAPHSSDDAYRNLSRTAGQGPRPRDMQPQTPAGAAQGKRAPVKRAVKRLLIADDEENFRTFMGWALRQRGYEVILAANGQEAFDRFQEAPASIDLAILDAYMPLMGGLESYLRMQVLRPDLPVLFASGFVRGPSVETLIDGCPGPAAVLLKPFRAEDLIKAVESALSPVPDNEHHEGEGDEGDDEEGEDVG